MRQFAWIVAVTSFGLFLLAGPASATVLIFEDSNGNALGSGVLVDQGYGDRVTSASQNGFGYQQGFGWTPHITVSYGGSIYASGATVGGLTNFAYGDTGNNYASITLTADAGYHVRLDSFDLGINIAPALAVSVQILDSNNQVLWSLGPNAEIGGPTPGPNGAPGTTFFFPNITSSDGGSLILEWTSDDQTEGRRTSAISVDNAKFTEIPEPGTLTLLGLGGLALLVKRRRRRAHIARRVSIEKQFA